MSEGWTKDTHMKHLRRVGMRIWVRGGMLELAADVMAEEIEQRSAPEMFGYCSQGFDGVFRECCFVVRFNDE